MTTLDRTHASRVVLEEAAAAAGLPSAGAEVIRFAENDLWRLPGKVVARIARSGQDTAVIREVAVARWLAEHHVPAVRPLDIEQPVHAHGRAITFWEELPPHRAGTQAHLASLLRQLHDLPPPTGIPLGTLDPFVRVEDRLTAAQILTDADRAWLLNHLTELRHAWQHLPCGRPVCVVHGDAWAGNCAVTEDGQAYLLDFERTSLGRPEWDLTSTAVATDTLGSLDADAYAQYCTAYGRNVRNWKGYATMRAIRELRMTSFAFQAAAHSSQAQKEALYRLACLQGRHGARPWGWTPMG